MSPLEGAIVVNSTYLISIGVWIAALLSFMLECLKKRTNLMVPASLAMFGCAASAFAVMGEAQFRHNSGGAFISGLVFLFAFVGGCFSYINSGPEPLETPSAGDDTAAP